MMGGPCRTAGPTSLLVSPRQSWSAGCEHRRPSLLFKASRTMCGLGQMTLMARLTKTSRTPSPRTVREMLVSEGRLSTLRQT
jgi:hypothetical protein